MENNQSELFGFNLENEAQEHLKSAAKWEKFMAITQIAMMSLFILLIIFGGSTFVRFMETQNSLDKSGLSSNFFTGVFAFMFILYIIIAAVIIIPNVFRLKFANAAIKAINTKDYILLTQSFKHFKTHSIFWGVLTIISIVIYVFYIFIIGVALIVK